jgi:hypothetical protein
MNVCGFARTILRDTRVDDDGDLDSSSSPSFSSSSFTIYSAKTTSDISLFTDELFCNRKEEELKEEEEEQLFSNNLLPPFLRKESITSKPTLCLVPSNRFPGFPNPTIA